MFNKLSPLQLVVGGFSLPIGTTVAANGTLVLPAGVAIGSQSPGGGARVVVVHSVQVLGELLSEGYVAMVIDLSGRMRDDKMQLVLN